MDLYRFGESNNCLVTETSHSQTTSLMPAYAREKSMTEWKAENVNTVIPAHLGLFVSLNLATAQLDFSATFHI